MSLFLVVSLSLYFLLQTRFFVISLSLSLFAFILTIIP